MISTRNIRQLSRTGNEKEYEELERRWIRLFNHLVDLSQGAVPLHEGVWFYSLFLGGVSANTPDTAEEVRDYLQTGAGWWTEREDAKQQILLYVHRYQLYLHNSDHALLSLTLTLGRHLRDWLRHCKVFSRHSNWKQRYWHMQQSSCFQEVDNVDIRFLLETNAEIDIFNRYMFYLLIVLNLPLREIIPILISQERQVNRFMLKFYSDMEEKLCQQQDIKEI